MQHNYKLNRAVATALSLIALGLQGNALALGLGDIEIKSHLGQPLKAKINVLGAGEIKDADCFKLNTYDGGSNQLSHANLRLSPIVGDSATLMITTNQVINEPILNVSVVASCETSVRRDYVLLIDPLLTAEADRIDGEIVTTVPEDAISAAEEMTAKTHHKQTIAVAERKRKKINKSQSKLASNKSNPDIVLHVAGGNTDESANKLEKSAAISNKPKLSISQGSHADLTLMAAGLRMDKQLSFEPDASGQPAMTETDILDEVTAMHNRLAHLEKQISKLQQENIQLKTENSLKTEQLAEENSFSNKLSDLVPLFAGGLSLLSGYYAVGWWRRRQLQQQAENVEAIWASQNHHDFENDAFNTSDDDIFSDIEQHQANKDIDKKTIAMEESFEATKTAEDSIVLLEDDDSHSLTILDHADVFLSHGRTSLAIQLLQNHLLDNPKQSVTIWLFLLDLLAKENLQAVYEQTALDCKEHFNIKISEFARGDKNTNHDLESFPHLTEGLQQAWNTQACIVYLDDLIYNNRLEPRAGLDKNLIEELLLLKSIAQENQNSAEVIHLDAKKLALKEQKEALIATKKAEKLSQLAENERLEKERAEALEHAEKTETKFDFQLVEWK